MSDIDLLRTIVFNAVDEHNELCPERPLSRSLDVVLYGEGATLSSVEFVGLIVDIETRLESHYKRRLVLADERAFSARNSPFRTLGTLLEFIDSALHVDVVRVG